mgnify:CR=1 FL=1
MSAAFDPLTALRALSEADVEFVVIGGIAARLHGSPSVTSDIDVCHARDAANLERLAAALRNLHARLRGVSDDVPFLLDAKTLSIGSNFTFSTDAGDVDILALPAGTTGYDALAARATAMSLGDVTIKVCDLDDLIAMKQAAARPKDLIEVEVLSALRSEIAQREG